MSHHENQNTTDNTKEEKGAQESSKDIWKKKEGVLKKTVFKLSFERINQPIIIIK